MGIHDTRLGRDSYSALVIGTGFGGSVTACRLAQAGIDVGVVERGRRWPPGSFPRQLSRLDDGWLWLCDHGLYDAKPLSDILAVCAAGYGGGSLVYANVAMRPPPQVFDDAWPDGYSRAALEPYYDLVAHMLGVSPTPADPATGVLPPKTELMRQAADRLGQADGFFRPNIAVTFGEPGRPVTNAFGVTQTGCRFCGECDIGCNYGSKNTLDLNYLALAETHGVDVGTLTEAVHLTQVDGGYRVRLREHGGKGQDTVERDVTAESVFVCAGAIGSTELLLRSRDQYRTLPDLPPSLGHGFSGNGDFLSFGRGTAERAEPSSGPTITTATVLRAEGVGREQWFVVEDGGYSEPLAALVRHLDLARLPERVAAAVGTAARQALGRTRDLGRTLDEENTHTAVLLAMGRDRADGRIELTGPLHRLRVHWDVPRNDPLYAAERAASAAFVRTLGAEPFGTPTWELFRQPVTVHNLGGCRMSDDPATGVTDPGGQVHGHPGLYVLDGASLPGATGANPSMTIAAVAERCVEAAARRLTGNPGWEAPERAVAVHRDPPEDAAIRSVLSRGAPPLPSTGAGVRFRERMSGSLTVAPPNGPPARRQVVMRLTATVRDLTIFLADPGHRVALTGDVRVGGLTATPVPVTAGTLHLLAPTGRGTARAMDYMVPFHDDAGREWVLQGRKDVSWHRRHGPWRATTRLSARLASAEGSDDPSDPVGVLSISPTDVARLLGSLRPVPGPRRSGPRWWPVVRFAVFFAGGVARGMLRLPSSR